MKLVLDVGQWEWSSQKKITVGRCDPCLTGSEPVLPTEVDPGI